MKNLTLDMEKLSVDSFEAGPPDQDCPAASATAGPKINQETAG